MIQTNSQPTAFVPADRTPPRPLAAAGLTLGLLLIYTLNYVDRQIVVILQEPIRAEFHLQDWQLGLLTGASISLFYTAMGIPIARWVDRGAHRVRLIAAITAIWSLMTMLCGVSRSYGQFIVARMGVGLAEAGFAPTSHSLLSDLYPLPKRPFAMGIFALGVPIGIMGGLVSGGMIAQHHGWRAALLMVGLPGLVAAMLFLIFAREPVRGASEEETTKVVPMAVGEAVRTLSRSRAYVHVVLASAGSSFTLSALLSWLPSFLIRVHGLTLTQAGLSLGLMMGCGGMIGVSLGGWQASRLAGRGLRAMLWMPIAGLTAAVPLFILALLATDIRVTLALLVVPMMLGNFWTAPSIALTQNLSPVAARATASAICIVASNLIGVALGPIAAGLASDAFARALGDPAQGLRWALIAAALTMFWGITHWVLAARALGGRRAPDPVAIAEVLPFQPVAGEVP